MNINLVSLWDEVKDKKIVVYDLETTGFKSKNTRILSFSAIRYQVSEHGMDEIDRRNMFLNPMMTIPAYITAVNHITNEKVADCPTEYEAGAEILSYLNSADFVSGYNNANFDDGLVNEMARRIGFGKWIPKNEIDVMILAKAVLTKQDVSNFKLGTLAEYFHADAGLEFHNSIDDVIATSRVLWGLVNKCRTDEHDEGSVVNASFEEDNTEVSDEDIYSQHVAVLPVNDNSNSVSEQVKAAVVDERKPVMLDPSKWKTFSNEDLTDAPVETKCKVKNDPLTAVLWEKNGYRRLYINNSLNHPVYYDVKLRRWQYNFDEDERMISRIDDEYDVDELVRRRKYSFTA